MNILPLVSNMRSSATSFLEDTFLTSLEHCREKKIKPTGQKRKTQAAAAKKLTIVCCKFKPCFPLTSLTCLWCEAFRKLASVIQDKCLLLKGKSALARPGSKGLQRIYQDPLSGSQRCRGWQPREQSNLCLQASPISPVWVGQKMVQGTQGTHPQSNTSLHVCHSCI